MVDSRPKHTQKDISICRRYCLDEITANCFNQFIPKPKDILSPIGNAIITFESAINRAVAHFYHRQVIDSSRA